MNKIIFYTLLYESKHFLIAFVAGPTHNNIWPVTSDFNPLDLANMTLQQSHDSFLNELIRKNFLLKGTFILWEILAKSIGNDFFGFIKDEKVNIRCNSIIKAVFDCISSLKLQEKVMKTISMARKVQSELKGEDKSDISQEFIRTCTNLDNLMENEPLYKSKRDMYMKQNLSAPKKTYQYSIGNPSEDQRKIIADLLNDPLLKKFWAHVQWMGIDSNFRYFEERKTKYAILALAKVPNKLTAVQRIYEQSVDELISFVKDFSSDNIFQAVDSPPNSDYFGRVELPSYDFPNLLIKQIVSKINRNADLVKIFKALNEPPGT